MIDLTLLERHVIEKLLAGEEEFLMILREQLSVAKVIKRKMTGAGFFSIFWLPAEIKIVSGNPSFELGDVTAKMPSVRYGAGFVLFVKNGIIDKLEGFTYDDPWPSDVSQFELSYVKGQQRDMTSLREKLRTRGCDVTSLFGPIDGTA
jgi:hypothetical protein